MVQNGELLSTRLAIGHVTRRPGSSPIGSPSFARFIFVKECKMLASLDMPHGPHSADMFAI